VLGGQAPPDTPKVTLVRAHDETIISLRSAAGFEEEEKP
jgi:hypothetical protein